MRVLVLVHLRVFLVLVHLQVVIVLLEGGRGHCWTERVVVHTGGHVLGDGLPVWRSGGHWDGLLVQLGGSREQLAPAYAVGDTYALMETDSGGAIVLVGLGAVMAGEVP